MIKIILTGATKGLGRALVDRFIEKECTIYGCGRSDAHIDELNSRYSDPSKFSRLDIADWEQVKVWAEELINDENVPDLLINNAAIMNTPAPLWKTSDKEFKNLIDVNVGGTANTIRAFLPAMIKNGHGIIVNMSSGWGRSTAPNVAPYCTSKWAIEGLTQALSQELPDGLAAVAVNPGVIDTDMLRTCWSDGAGGFQSAEQWSHKAAKFFLGLTVSDNGKSLSI